MQGIEKITISLPKKLAVKLRYKIPNRKRSKFIADIIENGLEKIE